VTPSEIAESLSKGQAMALKFAIQQGAPWARVSKPGISAAARRLERDGLVYINRSDGTWLLPTNLGFEVACVLFKI
jgi:hypothetical protein